MNRIILNGILTKITDPKEFEKDGKTYSYKTCVFSCNGTTLAANYWGDGELPKEGASCWFTANLSSHPNNHKPDLYYHKLDLVNIEEK